MVLQAVRPVEPEVFPGDQNKEPPIGREPGREPFLAFLLKSIKAPNRQTAAALERSACGCVHVWALPTSPAINPYSKERVQSRRPAVTITAPNRQRAHRVSRNGSETIEGAMEP